MDTNTTTTTAVPSPPSSSSPERRYSSSHDEQPKSHWWVWVLIAAILLIGGFIYYRHRQAAAEAAAKAKAAQLPRAVPIVTATAKKGDIGVYVEALGAVTPVYTVNVTSRVQGQVMNVYYKEGQMVRKGQPLLEIDPRPFQAALTQVEGQLEHDQALLAEARIDLDRYQQAFNRNAIAKQQLDDQIQLVKQDEGTVKNDQGQVANAQVNLAYTHITSPIDGRVGLRLVDPGNLVQANGTTPLVVITQTRPITVIFTVAEDDLPKVLAALHKQKHLVMDIYDREDATKIAVGKLETLDNEINTTTGTVKMRAE